MITPSSSAASPAVSAAVPPKLPVHLDTKGRLRVSKAQRRDLLAALTRSGESLPRFAERTATAGGRARVAKPAHPGAPPPGPGSGAPPGAAQKSARQWWVISKPRVTVGFLIEQADANSRAGELFDIERDLAAIIALVRP